MAGRVLVFAEQRDGAFRKSAFEAVALAHQLGSEVHALVVGDRVAAIAPQLGAYGATVSHIVEDPRLGFYWSEGYTTALAEAIKQLDPDLVLLVATAMGKDLLARTAARCGLAALTDAIQLEEKDGGFQAVKSMYGGKVFATARALARPAIASVRPGAYPAPPAGQGQAEARALAVALPAEQRARVIEVRKKEESELDVQEAEIIVSGGRGLKEPANFALLRRLAGLLGAAVGASRAAVDAGWIDHSHQVGQTGKAVAPKLYIAVGISGAIQHLAGMRTAKCILAINKDPDAPIFQVADYGIVGDLFKVVPALVAEVQKLKA
ncbi:MAG: electron transfer flavoprotein subunit alpha/FixB family protein [Candidatus Eisenbacteria bacterium]|nr:electron transfer flavoprotein subunit alpha/FixB family protein [Candidatus Eisenbacteria bacterium]